VKVTKKNTKVIGKAMTTVKIEPKHPDKLGRELNMGDCVVYPQSNTMIIGTVIKFTPKMITVKGVGTYRWETRKYSSDVIKIDGPEVTMYLIKNAGT
jgi:hexokinase